MGVDVNVKQRDVALDIAKGILIILMMVGHMEIPYLLREVIYSFHMPAFVFFSGYCFKPAVCDNIKSNFRNLTKAFLLPYAIWALWFLVMGEESFVFKIKNILCGMSNINKVFQDRTSVGQVYFLLLLFLVRLIYMFICKYIKTDAIRTIVIVMISLLGSMLGELGYWLPWSLDCSLYTLIFYHLGYLIKKYNVVGFIKNNIYCYFLLFGIWFFMIYVGGMELYPRQYGNYIITVLGAVCASIVLYLASELLTKYLKPTYKNMLVYVGKNTLSILLVHTIFGGYIALFVAHVSMKLGVVEWRLLMYTIVILLQTLLGMLWGRGYEKVCKSFFK